MTLLRVVPVYAALLAVMFVALSLRVVSVRRSARVSLGTGGDDQLERRVRIQANFAEYVPFALLLLAMAEVRGAPAWVLHALCLCLAAGRILHAWGLTDQRTNFRFRVGGIVLTFVALIGGAVTLLL